MRGPRFGINVTSTEQIPCRMPRSLVPTKVHERAPRTMVKRIAPCDVFGIVNDTCFAIMRAVRVLPRFTMRKRGSDEMLCCPDELMFDVVVDEVVAGLVVVVARVVVVAIVVVASVVVVAIVVVVGDTLREPAVTGVA